MWRAFWKLNFGIAYKNFFALPKIAPMASSSSSPSIRPNPSPAENPKFNLQKEVRNHEIAIGELSSLSASKRVYQKVGNIFFRRDLETAKAFQQKQLDAAKAQLQKLNSA